MNINIEHLLRVLHHKMGKDVEAVCDTLPYSGLKVELRKYHFLKNTHMTIAGTLYTYTNTNTVNIPEIQARIIREFRDIRIRA